MTLSVHTFETNPTAADQVFAFSEELGEGRKMFFIARFHPDTHAASQIADEIFGAVYEACNRSQMSEMYDQFEDGLKGANAVAQKHKPHFPMVPEMVVALFDFNQLYLTQSGEAESYLIRNGNISQISEAAEPSQDLFVNILSGQVSIGDIVLLSTHRLLRSLTTQQLSDIFLRQSFDEAVKIFRHDLSLASEVPTIVSAIGVGVQTQAQKSGWFAAPWKKKDTGVSQLVPATSSNTAPPAANPPSADLPPAMAPPSPATSTSDYQSPPAPAPRTAAPAPAARPSAVNALGQRAGATLGAVGGAAGSVAGRALSGAKGALSKVGGTVGGAVGPQLAQVKKAPKELLYGIGGILLTLVVVLAGRAVLNYESEDEKVLKEQISIAQEAVNAAKKQQQMGEQAEASLRLGQAQEAVQKVLSSRANEDYRTQAQTILTQIQEQQQIVENAEKAEPIISSDLGLKVNDLDALGMLELNNSLYVYDTSSVHKTIRDIVEKGPTIAPNETIVTGLTDVKNDKLIFLTDSPRLIEYKNGVNTPMQTSDETWRNGVDIGLYGSFVYVLDPVENQIWKYRRQRDNYSSASAYNLESAADLSRAVSLAIDGSIYVLSDDGSITKLYQGNEVPFEFKDLPSTPMEGRNLQMYTDYNVNFIYVLDPDNSRLLVFTKGEKFATYKKQIFYNLDDVRDFVIDTDAQKAFVTTKDKIYEFPL